jgi:hypothetical protein
MKVVRLNENDIENLVKKIIREDDTQMKAQPAEPKGKSLVLLKTNNGELSTVDEIVRAIQQAKMAFEDLCNSKLTGKDGYSKEIDGIVNDFTKLEDKVRKSKETIGTFVQQKSKQDHMSYMKQKQRQRHIDHMKASKEGRYYA